MFGYILVLAIGGVLVVLWLARLTRADPEGQRETGGKPVQHDFPAADAPTPDRSATASADRVRAARRRTPPA